MNLGNASAQFLLFSLIVALLVNVRPSSVWRHTVLSIASLLFLASFGPHVASLLPLAGFVALGYAGLQLIRRRARLALPLAIAAVILAYMWLKKYTILPNGTFLSFSYVTVGLSYIFFRVLHVLIEWGQDDERPPIGLGAYLLYLLNFTTLVSGPIQRFDDFGRAVLPLDVSIVAAQFERIIIGFFKVNVLGLLLHAVQQNAQSELAHPIVASNAVCAAFRLSMVYPFFLYANFSGYIDMVIALARLMRLELPENFNRPFSATSFLDFWARWHITLSTWLRTYVYNALLTALMRRFCDGRVQRYLGVLCFFVTFFLVGIWHGRTSEFVVFGILQGGGVAVNKLWQLVLAEQLGNRDYRALAKRPLYVASSRGLVFTWFAFTMYWFWGSWQDIHRVFAALNARDWLTVWLAVWVTASCALAVWERVRGTLLDPHGPSAPVLTHRYTRTVMVSLWALLAFAITVLLDQAAPDIVYKAF